MTGDVVALASSRGLDFAAMARFAREQGGPRSGADLSPAGRPAQGARRGAHRPQAGTLRTELRNWRDQRRYLDRRRRRHRHICVYQSKGRRELPNDRILIDGNVEGLSKGGIFQGLHVFTSLQGVAVHINAFNFPVWGMLENFADALGRPARDRQTGKRHRLPG